MSGDKKLIDIVTDSELSTLSIIGMAKNTGKTVTLNTLVGEAYQAGYELGILSYGRDGEEVDAITKQKKPRIYIPPGTLFLTTREVVNRLGMDAKIWMKLEYKTPLGQVAIWQAGAHGGYCELVGINSSQQIKQVKTLIEDKVKLMLIDGALDRRSSAMPDIGEGFIMATGANLGNTENMVVEKTMEEINKLTTERVTKPHIRIGAEKLSTKNKTGVIHSNGDVVDLMEGSIVGGYECVRDYIESAASKIDAIYVNGALVEKLAQKLLQSAKVQNMEIIIHDGTKNFLNRRSISLLKKREVKITVLRDMKLLAITVNPLRDAGTFLDAQIMIEKFQTLLSVPVFDLMSEAYPSPFVKRGELNGK